MKHFRLALMGILCAAAMVLSTGEEGAAASNGYALSFLNNRYVTIPNADSLNPARLTVECWVKFRKVGDAAQVFLNKGGGSFLGGYELSLRSGGAVAFSLSANDTYRVESAPYSVKAETWHHIAGVFDGRYLRVFLDGEQSGVKEVGDVRILTAAPLYLNLMPAYSYPFEGDLDELRIWSVPRTAEEIRYGMDSEIYRAPGLVGAWHMNEGAGKNVRDTSGMQEGILGAYGNYNDPLWIQSDIPFERLRMLAPTTGQYLKGGTAVDIRWAGKGATSLRLEYSTDGGGVWTTISEGVDPASGVYSWRPPNIRSDSCLVRVVDELYSENMAVSPGVFFISPAFVRVLAPNGGEEIGTGRPFRASWIALGTGSLTAEYSTDGGVSWKTAAAGIPATVDTLVWIPPDENSVRCLFRIRDEADTALVDTSDAVFAMARPFVALSSPNGGESWYAGTRQIITWKSFGVKTVTIRRTSNEGVYWTTIADSVEARSGRLEWMLPRPGGANYSLRVSAVEYPDLYDDSDASFAILPNVIHVTAPIGGETFEAGAEFDVSWEATGGVDSVAVDLSADNGATWTELASGIEASRGACRLRIPSVESTSCLVRVRRLVPYGFYLTPETAGIVMSVFTVKPSGTNPWAWRQYTASASVNGLAAQGDYIWCATSGGPMRWDTRTLDARTFEGPPNAAITSIATGSDGTVWMGTTTGVVRFDGRSYTSYAADDGLPSPYVCCIAAGPRGEMWAGIQVARADYMYTSESWIARFDGTGWATGKHWGMEFGYRKIASLAVLSDSDVRAVYAGRLIRFDGAAWRDSVYFEGMTKTAPGYVASGPEGDFWLSGEGEISRCAEGRWETASFPGMAITSLAAGAGHTAVAGVMDPDEGRGVSVYDGSGWRTYFFDKNKEFAFTAVVSGPDGSIWAGAFEGLYRLKDGAWIQLDQPRELPGYNGKLAGVDGSGNPYFVTGNVLLRKDGGVWKTESFPEGSGAANASAVMPDGSVWIGTAQGAYRFDGASWTRYTVAEGLPDSAVTGVYHGLDGVVRVKTANGFARFAAGRWEACGFPTDGLDGRSIRDIAASADGTIWAVLEKINYFGDYPPAARLDGSRWTVFEPAGKQGQSMGLNTYLAPGPGGSVWAVVSGNWDGSYHHPSASGKAYEFSGGVWNYRFEIAGNVTCLAVTAENRLWVGAIPYKNMDTGNNVGGGLGFYQEGVVTFIGDSGSTPYGWNEYGAYLPDMSVTAVASSSDGSVWVQTANGFARFGRVIATEVKSAEALPRALSITGNHPNPFNPATVISFTLPESGAAQLAVYDIMGRKVRDLASGRMIAGAHTLLWDGRDDSGRPVSSGVYFARILMGGHAATRKMMLVK